MKKTHLNQGMLVGLLMAASAVSAEEYPAADFQPKVLFQDESVAVEAKSAASAASAPCVSQESAPQKQEVAEVEFDPRYPASNFQPKVLFSEAN